MGAPSGGSVVPDAMVNEADMEPSEPMPDAMIPDMAPPMPEADMGMPIAPECALSVATVLSREPRVEVTITVEDADTSLAALNIQLPGLVVDNAELDRNGQATITVEGLSEGSAPSNRLEDPNGVICRVSESVVVDTRPPHSKQILSVPTVWKGALQDALTSCSSIMFEGIIEDAHFDTDAEALRIEPMVSHKNLRADPWDERGRDAIHISFWSHPGRALFGYSNSSEGI